jgi:hypothetical protein
MKNKILKLVNSLEFQELKSYYGEKTLFNALNVERNENRHSAFIAWWLNPKSEHGLGDAPLKLFLRLVATKSLGEATFGIDGFDGAFYNRVLAGSYNIELLEDIAVEKNVGKICNNNSKDRIDIWTVLDLSYEEDGKIDRRIIPVVIENKIYSNDGKGQTERYLKAVTSYPGVENTELGSMGILLTVEPTQPSCNQFDNITYQDLLTYVIEPLVANVEPDSAQFVESFIRNLSLPALTNKKYYGAIATSQKEKSMLQRIVDSNREIFDTAFSSLYKPSAVKKILDKDSKVLAITDTEVNILRMLWDANEELFKAVIYHLYKEEHKTALDKLFKSSNRDSSKYIVYYKDEAVFPGKRLSKAMTACAIFKAYLKEYPATTLNDLQKAFPCEELNDYYYDRYYNDLFYESNPNNIDCEGEQVIPRTGGKNIGFEAQAKWDFYLDDEQLLPIENGTKEAMCVKMWRKGDFDRLIKHVHDKGYDKFITIEEC